MPSISPNLKYWGIVWTPSTTHACTHGCKGNCFPVNMQPQLFLQAILSYLFRRGNIKPNKRNGQKYLNKCHYNEKEHPYCPIFRLGYIAEQAREKFSELCRTVRLHPQSTSRQWHCISHFTNHIKHREPLLFGAHMNDRTHDLGLAPLTICVRVWCFNIRRCLQIMEISG
jgi:hypothetical protein